MNRPEAPVANLRGWTILAILLGLLLRAGFAIVWPTIQRPDETFQNLEPAYRLLTGWGIVSWEWRDGIRSFLFPDALAAIMAAARFVHLPLVPAVWVVLAGISAAGIAIAAQLGFRRYGPAGALICAALFAIWPDLVYFGPKPLLEVQSGNLLVIAAGLASLGNPRPPRMAAIGLLLGLVIALRFQLAPAAAVVGLAAIWRTGPRLLLALLTGAAIPLAALGALDAATWGSPFQSIWKNIDINLLRRRSEIYGTEPVTYYFIGMIRRCGVAAIPLAFSLGLGVRVAPILAAAALAVVAFHSLIAHKELSFIYAALPCAIILAGLGIARLWTTLAGRHPGARLLLALAFCASTAALAGLAGRPFREPSAYPQVRALWNIVRARPDLCGLALYGGVSFPTFITPGYVGLQRAIPIYLPRGPEALAAAEPAFNYLLVDTAALAALPDGEKIACNGNFCLIRRTHQCEPVPAFGVNAVLQQLGQ